jgi:hypothetical protein
MSASTDALTAAVAELSANVDKAVIAIQTGNPADTAAIEAATASIKAASDKLAAAMPA